MTRILLYGLALLACFFGTVANGQEAKYGRGYKPLTAERRVELYAVSSQKHGGRLAMLAKFQALPLSFDCREKGLVLPVGDQGQCGSCYLYSTVYGTMTSAFVKAGYGKADGSFVLSVQYGMDCHNFGGCNGGNGTEVIAWAVKNGWVAERWVDTAGMSRNDYPSYSANSQACRKNPGAKDWKIGDWGFVSASSSRPATTLEIKTALVNYGPLNVSLDAGGQFGDGAGVITALGRSIDHEIELVAYDDAKGAFLLKNQWTTQWGNGGYRWVTYQAAQNLVDVFFVTVAQLPPVPPDPTPIPIPPAGNDSVSITITQNGKSTMTVFPLTSGGITWPKDTPQWLMDAVNSQLKKECQKVEPKIEEIPKLLPKLDLPPVIKIERKIGFDFRLDRAEKNIDGLVGLVEKNTNLIVDLQQTVKDSAKPANNLVGTMFLILCEKDAVITYDSGKAMPYTTATTGPRRIFIAPPMSQEYKYAYDFTATSAARSTTKTVWFRPGESATVDLRIGV